MHHFFRCERQLTFDVIEHAGKNTEGGDRNPEQFQSFGPSFFRDCASTRKKINSASMKRLLPTIAVMLLFGVSFSSAQISSVTRRTVVQPMPLFPLWNTNAPSAKSNVVYVTVAPPADAAQKEDAQRKAVESEKKRAMEGSSGAQYDLGIRYLTGDHLEKNLELARQWFSLAAQQNNPAAIRKLEEISKVEPKKVP